MIIDTKFFQKLFLILISIYFVTLSRISAQNNATFVIHPYANNDSLKLEIHLENLFAGKIKKTLLAGLPILMEIDIQMIDSENRSILSKKITGKILYDVWEESFNIQGLNFSKNSLQTLDEIKDYFSKQLKAVLLSKDYLMSAEVYQIKSECHLTLLTQKQSRQLKDWIQSSEQTEEDLPSNERDTGFRLNLNSLVQFFMGEKDKPEEFLLEASSVKFRLTDLTN